MGIDLCPMKTCSYDCVFCQLGRTKKTTIQRKEFYPLKDIKEEIADWLKHDGHAEYITLAGSGEPTLYSNFGEIIDFIHTQTDIPVLLLSNGSLFWKTEVRDAAAKADVVKLSLSAWNQNLFENINNPAPEITFNRMFQGELKFREEYSGELVIEVFLLAGVNAILGDMKKIAELVNKIKPDKIHLNSVSRPVSKYLDYRVEPEKITSFTELFIPPAEIPQEVKKTPVINKEFNENEIFELIKRRPVTLDQLSQTFGIHPNEIAKITGRLIRADKIFVEEFNHKQYFKINPN